MADIEIGFTKKYPIDKHQVARDSSAAIERLKNRIAAKPVDLEKLSPEERQLYEEFDRLLSIVQADLDDNSLENSPHYAAQSVANSMGLRSYVAREGKCLRVEVCPVVLLDFDILPED